VPPVAGTPLKLSAASACRVVAEVEDATTPPYWREHLLDAFAGVIRGLGADWLVDARDGYFLARAHTGGPMLRVLGDRVVSFPACGGSSFKFAPLIARSLTERLTGACPTATGLAVLDAHPVMRGVS
jgi:sarcosine oxidase